MLYAARCQNSLLGTPTDSVAESLINAVLRSLNYPPRRGMDPKLEHDCSQGDSRMSYMIHGVLATDLGGQPSLGTRYE
jgi:hypothetical protein